MAKLEAANKPWLAHEVVIDKDEEVIGIYGTKKSLNMINSVGFITWRPPK